MAQKYTPSEIIRRDERAKSITSIVNQVSVVEDTIQSSRDIVSIYADLAHEIPDESTTIRIDVKAFRGVMTQIYAGLEEAIDMLKTVQVEVSLIDEDEKNQI